MKSEDTLSTEEKIKEAARTVFTKKGYAATKTRDIAEEAGLNLALLNYYFRSKEKLFELIMAEKIQQLFSSLAPALNNHDTSLEEKMDWIAANYIEMLLKNPDLPLFVLSEIRNDPERFGKRIQLENYIMKSYFIQQIMEKNTEINPMQFYINFLGMMVFPFLAKPIFNATGAISEKEYIQLVEQRKALIPKWMKMMLE
ncbi:TetR family transcriptional regulator [Pedobacter sp. HMWF019]|nr:TetR family transcriptional regulator [Pedobacter sp. HMWF019]PTS96787.1 TetR family transcriptional regulator [Pedobacter sp. HMWF019]